jgi:hypothetical protein
MSHMGRQVGRQVDPQTRCLRVSLRSRSPATVLGLQFCEQFVHNGVAAFPALAHLTNSAGKTSKLRVIGLERNPDQAHTCL